MKDVEAIEHGLSHAVSGFYGFIINLLIITILLLIGNLKLGLAVIVPIYISAILSLLSGKIQKKGVSLSLIHI